MLALLRRASFFDHLLWSIFQSSLHIYYKLLFFMLSAIYRGICHKQLLNCPALYYMNGNKTFLSPNDWHTILGIRTHRSRNNWMCSHHSTNKPTWLDGIWKIYSSGIQILKAEEKCLQLGHYNVKIYQKKLRIWTFFCVLHRVSLYRIPRSVQWV